MSVVATLFAPVKLRHTRFGLEFNIAATWSFKVAYNDKGGLQGGPLEIVKRELRVLPDPEGKTNHFLVELTDKSGSALFNVPLSKKMKFAEAIVKAAEDVGHDCIISFCT